MGHGSLQYLLVALALLAGACTSGETGAEQAPADGTTTAAAPTTVSPTSTSPTSTTSTVPATTTTTIAAPEPIPIQPPEGMELVWSDEFDGDSIDPGNWTYDIGGWGWGNGEAQYYTDRTENARVRNGMLVIEARFERFEESYYTSARLLTQGLQEFQYGYIEARIKPPTGVGAWPAFWMLGADFDRDPDDPLRSNWPDVGEIDIMEYAGREPDLVLGTLHGPGYAGAGGLTRWNRQEYVVGDDFHRFAIDWDAEGIRWLYDGDIYYELGPENLGGRDWVFDRPFFLILNLALGGSIGGVIALDTEFPQYLYVDYVRVYQSVGDAG